MFAQKSFRYVIVGVCVVALALGGWAIVSRARANRAQGQTGGQEQRSGEEQSVPELTSEERELKAGEEFEISLVANPSTGYAWEVAELDESKVQLVSDNFVEGSASGQVVGASGQTVLKFKALASGQTRIKLVYRRAWETGVEPVKTHMVQVDAR